MPSAIARHGFRNVPQMILHVTFGYAEPSGQLVRRTIGADQKFHHILSWCLVGRNHDLTRPIRSFDPKTCFRFPLWTERGALAT